MLAMTLEKQTWLHPVPAGLKMAVMALAMLAFLPVTQPAAIAALVLATGALYASLGALALRRGLRLLRPLALVLAVILVWHLFIDEARQGAVICLRILGLVALANLVTMTTRLDDMTAVLERLMAPARWLGLNTGTVSLAIAMVIRCIPVLTIKAGALREAWRARSPRRLGFQIAVPLVLVALDDADHLAEALRARGGVGGTG